MHGSHPAVLVVTKAENGGNLSFKEFRLPPVQTKPSLSSPSDDASSEVCETVAPPDSLKDLFFTPYTCIFWTIWLIHLLTLEESYRHIGLAFNADLSFNLSFDRAILKNISHWLAYRLL